MEVNNTNIGLWSKLGPRAVYGQSMMSLAEKNSDIIAMSADLGNASGLAPFSRKYPKQFINTGIAEQNLIGVSAGLAKEGFIPYASSFAPFVSMRASEQIRMTMGYMQLNVRVVALGSGLAMSFLGNSHYGLEDVAIMRAIPGITIVSPSDCTEVVKVIQASEAHKGPMYIRLTGAINNPVVNISDYEYKIGQAIRLTEGDDIAIVSTGSMVAKSIEVAEILSMRGIQAEVINMHTIKPLDVTTIEKIVNTGKPIITVEEHTVVGGLGSAVAECITTLGKKAHHKMIGLEDAFGKTAEYDHLLKIHGLDGNSIVQKIEDFLRKI